MTSDEELELKLQAEIDANPKPPQAPMDIPARVKLAHDLRRAKEMITLALDLARPRNIHGHVVDRTKCIQCERNVHPGGCRCICHQAQEMANG